MKTYSKPTPDLKRASKNAEHCLVKLYAIMGDIDNDVEKLYSEFKHGHPSEIADIKSRVLLLKYIKETLKMSEEHLIMLYSSFVSKKPEKSNK